MAFLPVGCGDTEALSNGRSAGSGEQVFALAEHELEQGRELQGKLLADGSASRADYERAVDAAGACFARHDLTFTNEGWDPIGNQSIDFTFGNPQFSDDRVLGYGDGCQKAYLQKVQEAFVTSSEPVMDPAVLTASQNCLAERGIRVTRTAKNITDLVAGAGDAEFKDVVACIKESATVLHPGRSIYVGE